MSTGNSERAEVARGALDDLDIDPEALTGEGLAQYLETRLQETLSEILLSPAWRLLSDPASQPAQVQAMLREIDLERLLIQPAAEAALHATLDALPDDAPPMLADMLRDRHAEMAALPGVSARAYARRGGNPSLTGQRMISPSAFSAIATWRGLSGNQWLVLGALYLVDGLMPLIQAMVEQRAMPRGKASRLATIPQQIGAYLDHTAESRAMIVASAEASPKSRTLIAYGFEYLRQTTPLPIWEAARARALRRDEKRDAAE